MPSTPLISRRAATAAVLLSPLWSLPASAAPVARTPTDADGSQLAAAIAGPQRAEANRARDGARHPFETLRFFDLAPDQSVIEVWPGGGWYTEILAPYLRDHGRLYAAHFPSQSTSDYERQGRGRFVDKLSKAPAVFDGVVLGELSADGSRFGGWTRPVASTGRPVAVDAPRGGVDRVLTPRGRVDRVLTFRNLHNWIEAGHLDETLRACFDALKPGGLLGVEEHRAPAGFSLAQIIRNGYVPEELVITRAQAAGFELAGRSEINANPRDTKDHPNGVWSLPPVLRGGEVDRDRYRGIGESDRMTLKFIRPRRG